MKLKDSQGGSLIINLHKELLMMPGEIINGTNCYLSIFKNDMNFLPEDSHRWLLGNQFMKNHYMVFDMTPHYQPVLENKGYNTIAISTIREDITPIPEPPNRIKEIWAQFEKEFVIGLASIFGLIALCCLIRCHLRNRRAKLDRMDRNILNNEASKIMAGFKTKMD